MAQTILLSQILFCHAMSCQLHLISGFYFNIGEGQAISKGNSDEHDLFHCVSVTSSSYFLLFNGRTVPSIIACLNKSCIYLLKKDSWLILMESSHLCFIEMLISFFVITHLTHP